MKKFAFTPFLILVLSLTSFTQSSKPKVFVAAMEDGFDTFIAAAIIDNNVPVTITGVESEADYIISGGSVRGQNHWYDTWFGNERDRNQGSIKLLKVADKTIVWAGANGDRSLWWGALKSGGQKKVANRLARKLKGEYFNGTYRPTNAIPSSSVAPPATPPAAKTAAPESFPPGANLSINSTPTGADIIVDGKFVGRTPTQVAVKDGDHVIAITKTGYPLWQHNITLIAGSKLSIEATLEKP